MDLEKIVTLFPGTSPEEQSGENLRYDPLYDQIKEAREEEDASLSQGIWERDLKKADWPLVQELCADALENRTKDLQIVAWLSEALCHIEGWTGLLKAFTLMRRFCETCWEACYPLVEEGEGLEYRLRILDWFLNKMAEYSVFMPLSSSRDITAQPLNLALWMTALNLDQIARRGGTAPEENGEVVTLQRFRTLLHQTSVQHLKDVLEFVADITAEIKQMQAFLTAHCQGQEPSFKGILDPLNEIEKICQAALKGRETPKPIEPTPVTASTDVDIATVLAEPPSEETVVSGSTNSADSTNSTNSADSTDPTNSADSADSTDSAAAPSNEVTIAERKDAYKVIGDLAQFLIEVDPQSPGPYLLQLIATWNGKKLPEILDDVAKGDSEGHKMLKLLSQCKTGS